MTTRKPSGPEEGSTASEGGEPSDGAMANPDPGRPGVRIPPPVIVWHLIGDDGSIVATTTHEQQAEFWEQQREGWESFTVARYLRQP